MKFNKDETYIFALGGLGEVGKNMYIVMHNDEIIITDAGVIFPGGELMGIDYVIPDVTFLKQNESKIKGLFITHGHEDHIGGIPFLLSEVNIPAIYAPNQAAALIKKKLEDRKIKYNNLFIYNENSVYRFKDMWVEFYRTTHSIPDSHGIVIHTPDGVIMTTGDFKFDLTPIGPMADVQKIARLGSEGVTLLLSDSTNAMNPGINIYRLKHIVDTCKRHGRKIAVFGRSMENNIEISIEGGYIKHKEIFITPEEATSLPSNKVCLLCTGTQGEPLAALSRLANGTFRHIKLRADDVVVFSSSAIPGNALSISRTINKLYLKGITVYTNTSLSDIHASGHANEEELKWMIRLVKPKYFMPFHGEYRMLKKHADIASEYTYVDGNRIGDVSNAVMKDRKIMANDGIVVVIANIDVQNGKLLANPNIITRGFVLVNDNLDLLKKLEFIAKEAIVNKIKTGVNYIDVKTEVINSLSSYINLHTGRKPIILPVIMNIKKDVKI